MMLPKTVIFVTPADFRHGRCMESELVRLAARAVLPKAAP
jgi:hypothetical protein